MLFLYKLLFCKSQNKNNAFGSSTILSFTLIIKLNQDFCQVQQQQNFK
jgi:hypothetical protein